MAVGSSRSPAISDWNRRMSSISHSDTRGPAIDSEKISSRHHVAPGFESDAALVSSATNSSLARLARATFRLRRTGSREIGRCPTHACTKLWGIELDALRSVLVRCRWLLSGKSRSVAPSRGAISVDDGRRYSSFHPARGCGPDCTGHRHGQVLARDRLCKDARAFRTVWRNQPPLLGSLLVG